MRLSRITEAKYHGDGLSQQERENLVHKVKKLFDIKDIHHDDWRVSLEVNEEAIDYIDTLSVLVRSFGPPNYIDGYTQGQFHKNIHPQWKIKDHQIVLTSGYGDIDIEISKL